MKGGEGKVGEVRGWRKREVSEGRGNERRGGKRWTGETRHIGPSLLPAPLVKWVKLWMSQVYTEPHFRGLSVSRDWPNRQTNRFSKS